MIKTLLRMPGRSLSSHLHTGLQSVDQQLAAVDRRLMGSQRVREPIMAELRDHAMSSRQSAEEAGRSPSEAEGAALESIADADPLILAHNQALAERFIFIALLAGVAFGLFMAVPVWWSGRMTAERAAIAFAVMALYGPALAWLATYLNPRHVVPTALGNKNFTVAYRPSLRVVSVLLSVFIASVAVFISIPGKIAEERFGAAVWNLVCCIFVCYLFSFGWKRFDVNGDNIAIRWTLRQPRFRFNQIRFAAPLGQRHRWIPLWVAWHRAFLIEYVTDKGAKKRTLVFADMENAELLMTRARDVVRGV